MTEANTPNTDTALGIYLDLQTTQKNRSEPVLKKSHWFGQNGGRTVRQIGFQPNG
jgi:hypothetical protein